MEGQLFTVVSQQARATCEATHAIRSHPYSRFAPASVRMRTQYLMSGGTTAEGEGRA